MWNNHCFCRTVAQEPWKTGCHFLKLFLHLLASRVVKSSLRYEEKNGDGSEREDEKKLKLSQVHYVPLEFNGQLIRLHELKDWLAKAVAVFLSQPWQKQPYSVFELGLVFCFCVGEQCAILKELNPWKLSCLRCMLLFHLWFWEDNESAGFFIFL